MNTKERRIVDRQTWLAERRALLVKEKAFTRARDDLSRERRELPWVRIEKTYTFEGVEGSASLADVFDGRSQLVVYHFMFDPSWEAGCKSCSFWADNFERSVVHLHHRDVTLVAVSRAPLAKLTAYARRMAWTFPLLSSGGSDFNHDFGVSFTPEQIATGSVDYNYASHKAYGSEMPGVSVFAKGDDGSVFHTYSAYARGLDMLNAAYHYLDIVPKGRDEGAGIMAWLRRRDEYRD